MTVLVFIACFSGRTSIVISCLFREQSKLLTRGAGYDLTKLEEWSDTWLLRFHPDKCKHMHIGKKNDENSYSIHRKSLEKVIEEKDIGVAIDLTFEKHINEKINKANQMFATLRRTFQFMDKSTFVQLYKSLVRTHLDYASSVWAPFKAKHIKQIEGVQRRATKQIPGFRDMTDQTNSRI